MKWVASAILLFGLLVAADSVASAQTWIVRMPWYESAIDSNAITFSWATSSAMPSRLRSGLTSNYEFSEVDAGAGTVHTATITGLTPATTYQIQLISGTDTVRCFSSTSSDYRSSGAIEVFFNRSADTADYPSLTPALANQNYLALLHEKIMKATASIDLAVYSYSGVTGDSVTTWLTAAHARGIKIRVIADSASVYNSSSFLGLAKSGIRTIMNSFGNNAHVASNIHHNKFIVIDGRADDGANVWALTGSWNLSDEQTTTDYQNVIHFQDLSIARTFEREFNEEWGSSGDLPDARFAEFSTNKHDTTARSFNIHGTPVHLFFSPNMGAFTAIDYMLQHVQRQVLYALFVFTRQELAQSLIADHQAGIDIHGVVNDVDKYEQTPVLQNAGIDALSFQLKGSILLHHKYAILDVGLADAAVITGSYNWSESAETVNNENVLIVESNSVAEQYFQEWVARYKENGGIENVTLPLLVANSSHPAHRTMIYPNPTNSRATIEWQQARAGLAHISIYDALGRSIMSASMYANAGSVAREIQPLMTKGVYTVTVEHDQLTEVAHLVSLH